MTLVLFLLGGVAIGALLERFVGPGRTAEDASLAASGAIGVASRPRRRRSPRRILRWTSLMLVVLLVVGGVGGYLWASSVFDKIEKVDVSDRLSGGSRGTNYLLVGSDNGKDPDEQREGVAGARSDTIMVLNIEGGKAKMLSLNRDLFVTNPATGEKGRLNATYNAGPANLIQAVTDNFAIPVDRYIEIDFASFGGLVDAFGGIDVDLAHPAFDLASGLDQPTAGRVQLDGEQALAFVRSRHYTEVIDGQNVQDPTSDLGRVQRQQVFLREIMKKAGAKRNPITLMSAASKMSGGLRIDDDMTMLQAASFAWSMGKLNPETVVLPTVPRTTPGGAAVLEVGEGADAVLAQFR